MRHRRTTPLLALGLADSSATRSARGGDDRDRATVWSVVGVLMVTLVLLQVLVASGGVAVPATDAGATARADGHVTESTTAAGHVTWSSTAADGHVTESTTGADGHVTESTTGADGPVTESTTGAGHVTWSSTGADGHVTWSSTGADGHVTWSSTGADSHVTWSKPSLARDSRAGSRIDEAAGER